MKHYGPFEPVTSATKWRRQILSGWDTKDSKAMVEFAEKDPNAYAMVMEIHRKGEGEGAYIHELATGFSALYFKLETDKGMTRYTLVDIPRHMNPLHAQTLDEALNAVDNLAMEPRPSHFFLTMRAYINAHKSELKLTRADREELIAYMNANV